MKLIRIALLFACVACTPAAGPILISQVPVDVATDIGCFVADAIAGNQSAAQIFAQCGQITAEQAAALLAALAQGGGIAVKSAGATFHVPIVTLSDATRARIASLQSQIAGAQ